MVELDHAAYVMNFERIELGLSPAGEWGIYYCYPCRFLDREDYACRIHNAPEQPQICVHYNPYNCWYKRVFTSSRGDEFLRVDRQRWEWVVSQVVLDEHRKIVQVPDWASLVEGVAKLPPWPAPATTDPPESYPVLQEWKEMVLHPDGRDSSDQQSLSYDELRDPCSDCAAYCCTTLVFPHGFPATAANLDHLRFCLGFPGIELGIAEDTWSLIVNTRCRHLDGNRCSIFGKPERPILCQYYDAWKCTYRVNFGMPRPPGFSRVRLEEFEWLTECFRFDQHGNIIEGPKVEQVRAKIEEKWQNTVEEPAES
jgi:Fe-S-cluster containining protein